MNNDTGGTKTRVRALERNVDASSPVFGWYIAAEGGIGETSRSRVAFERRRNSELMWSKSVGGEDLVVGVGEDFVADGITREVVGESS